MSESEPQERRGRPRIPESTRKRLTITFRVREELREAVEEQARANNRTLSEQVEYYVDSSVFDEAMRLSQCAEIDISPTMKSCILTRQREDISKQQNASNKFKCTPVLHDRGSPVMKHPVSWTLPLSWAQDPAQRDDALHMAQLLFDASKKGAIEALSMALGDRIVADMLVNNAHTRQRDLDLFETASATEKEQALTAEIERLKAELEKLTRGSKSDASV